MTKITVSTIIDAPLPLVWHVYTNPADIKIWNAASDDWHTTSSQVDLRAGGAFCSRMEARNGSSGFDFAGVYTKIIPFQLIEYTFGDRLCVVEFGEGVDAAKGVTVRVAFESETTHSLEQQRDGWQAILNNFAKHVKEHAAPRAFAHTRMYGVKPSDIFAAIRNADRLARWWGPNGFTNRFESFDFSTGGQWKFLMVGPDGAQYPNSSRFAQIDINRRVVIEHVNNPLFQLHIDLYEQQDGTLLSWIQRFNEESVARALEHIVKVANEENLGRLGAELAHKL